MALLSGNSFPNGGRMVIWKSAPAAFGLTMSSIKVIIFNKHLFRTHYGQLTTEIIFSNEFKEAWVQPMT